MLAKAAHLRCSLYADDAGIFARPEAIVLQALANILDFFGKCSGLKINMTKTEVFPIQCGDLNLEDILTHSPGKIAAFPGKYLGLPLHTRKLRKVELQPLIEKIGSRLPGWKGRFFTKAGRETLVRAVLSSQPIYQLTVFPLHKCLIKKID